MTETTEDQLLVMKPHLLKINKCKNVADAKAAQSNLVDGKIELANIKHKISHHLVVLYPDSKADIAMPVFKRADRKASDSTATYASMNQEWRTMFAAQDNSQVILF